MRPHHSHLTGRAGRFATGAAAAVAVVLASAPGAEAKVWFQDMGGRVLRWDHVVSSTILGCPGNESCREAVEGVTVYLRRTASPRNPDLLLVGRITGRGMLTFQVPRVGVGRYHLVARVRAGETTQLVKASSSFRVVRR